MIRAISDALKVWNSPVSLGEGHYSKISICVRGRRVFSVWNDGDNIMQCESRKGNNTRESIGHGYYPDITHNGSRHIVWESKHDTLGYVVVYLSPSRSLKKISGSLPYAECPQIVSDGPNIYVVFQSRPVGQASGVYMVSSRDNGATWDVPVKFGDGSMPRISYRDNFLDIVWSENSPYGVLSIRFDTVNNTWGVESVISDGHKEQTPDVFHTEYGNPFFAVTRYSDFKTMVFTDSRSTIPSFLYSMWPRVAFFEGAVQVSFQAKSVSTDNWKIYTISLKNGKWSNAKLISNNSLNNQSPSIASSDKIAAIAYTDGANVFLTTKELKV